MQSGQRTRSQLKENHAAAGLLLQLPPGGETHNTPQVVTSRYRFVCVQHLPGRCRKISAFSLKRRRLIHSLTSIWQKRCRTPQYAVRRPRLNTDCRVQENCSVEGLKQKPKGYEPPLAHEHEHPQIRLVDYSLSQCVAETRCHHLSLFCRSETSRRAPTGSMHQNEPIS